MEKIKFNFEGLEVWARAVEFANGAVDICDRVQTDRKHYRLIEQLEASAASVAMNIAEGKGRYSKKEFVQFLYVAKGSLFETVTILTIFQQRGWITEERLENMKVLADGIGKKLSNLISSVRGF
jgi:four helix bundle protein